MIKTLADLNNAGKKLWGAKDKESIQEQVRKYIQNQNYDPPDFNTPEFEKEYLKQSGAKDVHPATKNNAPPGMEKCPNCGGYGRKYGEICDVCHGKGFIPEGSADKARDFTTNPAEIEAAAKKAKAAGKSKEDFVAGYSGGAAETAARAWGKDSGIKTLADLNKAGRRFWRGPNLR